MNDPELVAALVADRRLNHFQVTALWAAVSRLAGRARARISHGDLAHDLRVSRRTVLRALGELPEGLPLRVEGAAGASPLFVVPAREPEAEPDAAFASGVRATGDSQSQVAAPASGPLVTGSHNAARRCDPQSQVAAPASGPLVTVSHNLDPPLVTVSHNAARRCDPQSQVTLVHTPILSAIGGGRGGSALSGISNRLGTSEDISSDAGAREGQSRQNGKRNGCVQGHSELEERAKDYHCDPMKSSLMHGEPSVWPEVIEVTKCFTEVWGREVRLTGGHPGVRKIVERFAEGYTVAELSKAVAGAYNDPWYQRHRHYQTLQTILRDTGQVEKFTDMCDSPPVTGIGGKTIQPNHAGVDVFAKHRVIEAE